MSPRVRFAAGAGAAVVAAILASTSCATELAISNDSSADDAGTEGAPQDSAARDGEAIDSTTPEAGIDTGAARHLRVFALTVTWDIAQMHLVDGGMTASRRDSADLFCADEATLAGLGNKFVAWMSVGASGSDAIARLPTDADWSLPVAGGAPVLVFPSRVHIDFGKFPMVAINRGANGVLLADAETHVWTGTNVMGRSSGNDCENWGILTGSPGTTGRTDSVSAAWTAASDDSTCGASYHLYCFGL